jgi:hypothetical protein
MTKYRKLSRSRTTREIFTYRRFFLRSGGDGGSRLRPIQQKNTGQTFLWINQENSNEDRLDALGRCVS